jgi:hypothetical protein
MAAHLKSPQALVDCVAAFAKPPCHRNAGEKHANGDNYQSDLKPDKAAQFPQDYFGPITPWRRKSVSNCFDAVRYRSQRPFEQVGSIVERGNDQCPGQDGGADTERMHLRMMLQSRVIARRSGRPAPNGENGDADDNCRQDAKPCPSHESLSSAAYAEDHIPWPDIAGKRIELPRDGNHRLRSNAARQFQHRPSQRARRIRDRSAGVDEGDAACVPPYLQVGRAVAGIDEASGK